MSEPSSQPASASTTGTISASGTGRASAAPDVMRIQLAASAMRPTVAAALAASEQAATAIRGVLTAAGVPPADAATVGLSITAEQVWGEQTGPRTVGFRSEHRLSVSLRDLTAAGALLGDALAAGGDDLRLDAVSFEVEDDTELRRLARAQAWARAEDVGRQLAELSGRRLGPVQTIGEQSGNMAMPVFSRQAMSEQESGKAIGVEPGVVAVEVTLGVQWSLVEG